MKKILISLLVAMLLATTAYAWQDTEEGPINITSCWIDNEANLVSGDVVVLQTTSPTFPGREVTTTTTAGLPIYGVVLGDPTANDCDDGSWIRIQTHGYTPNVRIAKNAAVTAGTTFLVTSSEYGRATSGEELKNGLSANPYVSGASVVLETAKGSNYPLAAPGQGGNAVSAMLSW